MTNRMTDPSDIVGTKIEYDGELWRITGYEQCPRSTPENRKCAPIYLLVEADRKPPYDSWRKVLVSEIEGTGS